VFVDRLAVLTHNRTTATADEFDRYLSYYGPFCELDIQHMRPDICVGIPGAPKASPSSSWQSECTAGGQGVPRSMGCQQNNIPLLGIYTLCIGCNSRMHKGCGLSLGKINKRWPVVCGQCISKDATGLSGDTKTNKRTPDAPSAMEPNATKLKKARNDSGTKQSAV
jgi:hypothetical protein